MRYLHPAPPSSGPFEKQEQDPHILAPKRHATTMLIILVPRPGVAHCCFICRMRAFARSRIPAHQDQQRTDIPLVYVTGATKNTLQMGAWGVVPVLHVREQRRRGGRSKTKKEASFSVEHEPSQKQQAKAGDERSRRALPGARVKYPPSLAPASKSNPQRDTTRNSDNLIENPQLPAGVTEGKKQSGYRASFTK